MGFLLGIWRFFCIALITLVLALFVVFVLPVLTDRARVRWIRRFAAACLAIFGVRFVLKGRVPQDIDEKGLVRGRPGYMVCANHISFLDIFALESFLPVRFVAKREIADWPIFGMIAKGAGTLFIDRSRKRAVLEMAETMQKSLEAGESVLFFPEGTTGPGDKLLPFYANLFAAGVAAQTRILPVAVRYVLKGETTTVPSYAGNTPMFEVMKRIVRTPGLSVEVNVLEPIDTVGKTRQEVCAIASAQMAAALGMPDATAEKAAAQQAKLRAAEEA